MGQLTITRGLPASGKTTWALKQIRAVNVARVNRDDTRQWLGVTHGEDEVTVSNYQLQRVKELLRQGKNVIVDDCNLKQRYAQKWCDVATQEGAKFNVADFTNVSVMTCLERDYERRNNGKRYVGSQVIIGLYDRYLKNRTIADPEPKVFACINDTYVPNASLPSAYIVDIDGTLANHEGIRNPYDTTLYSFDKPHNNIIDIVNVLESNNAWIIVVSGRSEDFRAVTVEWLDAHYVKYDKLLMRPSNDVRRDDIVKKELFDNYIRNEYNVLAVLDDRDRVVKMWRSLGLTTLQVAEGDF